MRRVLILLPLLAAACDFIREPEPLGPTDRRVMVHSVLQAGSDTVSVLINRTTAGTGADDMFDVAGVSGAMVQIIADSGAVPDTVTLSEAPDGFPSCYSPFDPAYSGGEKEPAGEGCYAAVLPGGVQPGARYLLRAELPDGSRVEGAAVIPEPPVLERPAAGVTVDTNEGGLIAVKWTGPPGSAAEVGLFGDRVWRGTTELEAVRCYVSFWVVADQRGFVGPHLFGSSDSVQTQVNHASCVESGPDGDAVSVRDWDSVAVRVQVAAYDTAAARYVQEMLLGSRTVDAARTSAGLSGAPGLFAGAATAERRIIIVGPPQP